MAPPALLTARALLFRLPLLRDPDTRGPLGLSLGLHLAVLLFIILGGIWPSGRATIYAPVYTVDLVTLPGSSGSGPAPSPEKAAPAPPTAAPAPPQETKKIVRPDAVVLPVKASSPDREEIGAADEAALRKKKREELEKAITQQTSRLAAEKYAARAVTIPPKVFVLAPAGGKAGPAGTAGASGKASGVDIILQAWYDRVWERVRACWVLPEGVNTSNPLLTKIGIRVAPSGRLEDLWVEEGSGNIYYDQSALRAVKKSDPLPPLPPEHGGASLEVGINFRPQS